MSYLAFQSRTAVTRLPGRQVHTILRLAQGALEAGLSRGRHRGLRDELGLPAVDSQFFASHLLWLMTDDEAHRAGGHDVYLMGLALQVMYDQSPKNGILCWLYALNHG